MRGVRAWPGQHPKTQHSFNAFNVGGLETEAPHQQVVIAGIGQVPRHSVAQHPRASVDAMPPVFKKPLVSDARVGRALRRQDVPRLAVACRLIDALVAQGNSRSHGSKVHACMISHNAQLFACTPLACRRMTPRWLSAPWPTPTARASRREMRRSARCCRSW